MAQTSRKWSSKVNTDSTHPQKRLFNKDRKRLRGLLLGKKVSPKGPGSGMRMLTFYINRADKNLSASRNRALAKAKQMLAERVRAAREREKKRAA